ncbi:hypothetical protein Gasu2_36150 [Galdieria sulphuraria]|nr:hypothetical protein Gasu2_36150 [Galdieria sulphuraria]
MDRDALMSVPRETLSRLEKFLESEPEGFPEFPQETRDDYEEETASLTPIVSILGEFSSRSFRGISLEEKKACSGSGSDKVVEEFEEMDGGSPNLEADSSCLESEESSYSPSEVSNSRRTHVKRSSHKVSVKNKECMDHCTYCGKSKEETPMMRRGPSGKTELCNASIESIYRSTSIEWYRIRAALFESFM